MIPVNEPVLNGNEKKYLCECIDSGWISSEGPFVKRFEEEFAAYHGRKFGIATANGSGALDVAIAALDLSPGDEVIMPALTIISCALSIVRSGGVPVLVDSDPRTWNIRTDLIEEKITPRTKAIMVVHLYGLPVDMDPILTLAEKYGLKILEDSAEAIGLTYRSRLCGSFGTISVFSFYPNKHVITGEGGMLLTDDEKLGCVVNRFVLYYANVKKRISGKWRMHTNDMIYRMNLGLKSNFCYRGARELGAATLATTGNLSMRYFGFYERGHLGVICHRVTEIGKILTGVFAVGVTKEFGRNYCRN